VTVDHTWTLVDPEGPYPAMASIQLRYI